MECTAEFTFFYLKRRNKKKRKIQELVPSSRNSWLNGKRGGVYFQKWSFSGFFTTKLNSIQGINENTIIIRYLEIKFTIQIFVKMSWNI